MMSSSLFHTMSCHSTRSAWQKLDHVSIMVALYGTYVRVIINNFSCFPHYQNLHLAVVTILFGSVIFLKSFGASYGPSQKASLPLFLGLALYSIAPFLHWVQLSSFIENSNVTSLVGRTSDNNNNAKMRRKSMIYSLKHYGLWILTL